MGNKTFMIKIRQYLNSKEGSLVSLILIYLAGVIFTILVSNTTAYGPNHFNDEVRYWNMAVSIYNGNFTLQEFHHYPILYPLSLYPAFLFSTQYTAYQAAKVLNALYICSVIFPFYLLLRKFTSRSISVITVAFLLLYPVHLVMPRSILSENLFYPLLIWTILLSFTHILPDSKRNCFIENVILGILIAFLYLTRYIAMALIPAFLLIWWIKPFKGEKTVLLFSSRKVIELFAVVIPMFIIIGIWLGAGLRQGLTFQEAIGLAAENPYNGLLGKRKLLMWAVFYLSYTILLAAPFLPLLLTSISRFEFKKWLEGLNRWWVSLLVFIFFLLVPCVRHSWQESYNNPDPNRVMGRYIFYFGPLFIVTVVISIDKIRHGYKKWLLWFFAVLSLLITSVAYAILFKGFIYLDYPLGISRSSPFGNIITSIDGYYILFIAIISVLTVTLLIKNSKLVLPGILLVISVFLVFGGYFSYREFLLPRQLPNYQITQTIAMVEQTDDLLSEFRDNQLDFLVKSSISESQIYRWESTLEFRGYTDFEFVMDEQETLDSSIVFQVDFGSEKLNLRKVPVESYAESDNHKFTFNKSFYLLEEID